MFVQLLLGHVRNALRRRVHSCWKLRSDATSPTILSHFLPLHPHSSHYRRYIERPFASLHLESGPIQSRRFELFASQDHSETRLGFRGSKENIGLKPCHLPFGWPERFSTII
jgi:hypothetical protein